MLPWGNNGDSSFQFFAPPVTQTNPGKRAPGKIRARWSNKTRYNPIKTKRSNTPETSVTNMDITDANKAKVPLSFKVCERFRPSCSFCKQNVSHPHPKSHIGQMEIGGGTYKYTKAKRGTYLLSDWDIPKLQSNPNSKPEVDKINMDKINLEHDNPQEEWIHITDLLILPATTDKEETATMEEKTDTETRYQQEEENYELQQKI